MNKLQNKATEDVDVTSQIKVLGSVQLFTSKNTTLPAFEVLTNSTVRPVLIFNEN